MSRLDTLAKAARSAALQYPKGRVATGALPAVELAGRIITMVSFNF